MRRTAEKKPFQQCVPFQKRTFLERRWRAKRIMGFLRIQVDFERAVSMIPKRFLFGTPVNTVFPAVSCINRSGRKKVGSCYEDWLCPRISEQSTPRLTNPCTQGRRLHKNLQREDFWRSTVQTSFDCSACCHKAGGYFSRVEARSAWPFRGSHVQDHAGPQ